MHREVANAFQTLSRTRSLQQVRTTNGALTEHFEEVSPDMHTTAEVTRSEVPFLGSEIGLGNQPTTRRPDCENTQRVSEKVDGHKKTLSKNFCTPDIEFCPTPVQTIISHRGY